MNWINGGNKDLELQSRKERKRLSLLRRTNGAFSVKQDIRPTHIDISIYVHIYMYIFFALHFVRRTFVLHSLRSPNQLRVPLENYSYDMDNTGITHVLSEEELKID